MGLMRNIKGKIVGAGSIGNHLCYAARSIGWEITVVDIDQVALNRMRSEIYPSRYGAWDTDIQMLTSGEEKINSKDCIYDIVFICTPPDSHLKVASEQLVKHEPKYLFIEKPISSPNSSSELEKLKLQANKTGTKILVGYNHRLTPNTNHLVQVIQNNSFGQVKFLRSNFRENWEGILNAHPWISGLNSTYLGNISLGGGALFEHSHGLDLFLYISKICGLELPKISSISMSRFNSDQLDYDENSICIFEFSKNILGIVEQNVFTRPGIKMLEIEFEDVLVKWFTNSTNAGVEVIDHDGKVVDSLVYNKKRSDDFQPQIQHIDNLILGSEIYSPIAISETESTQSYLEQIYKRFKS